MRWSAWCVVSASLWLTACFNDTTAENGAGNETGGCVEGAAGCECYANGTCDAALTCFSSEQVCVPTICEPVVAGCPCPASGCGDGLVCEGPLCVAEGVSSSTGTEGQGSSTTTGEMTTVTTLPPSTTGMTTSGADSTSGEPSGAGVTLYFSPSDVLFAGGGGAEAARTSTSEICDMGMVQADPTCTDSIAVFSAGSADDVQSLNQIYSMPFSIPVRSLSGEAIAPSFGALLDDGPSASLHELGVRFSDEPAQSPPFFWTGSDVDGASYTNCDDWATLAPRGNGKGAAPATVGEFWLSDNDYDCGQPAPVLCACWS